MNTFKKIFYTTIMVMASYASHAQANNYINLTNFAAHEKDNKLSVNWATDGAVATNYFEIQRSTDGKTFNTIAVVLGPDPRQSGDNYQYTERLKSTAAKHTYLRLKHVSVKGEEQLTKIIEI